MSDQIILQNESIINGNFHLLPNDFTFVVNGEEHRTSKFVASILSPVLANLLSSNGSLDRFEINTSDTRGEFQKFVNLIFQRQQEISNEDKEFICEILEILGNPNIRIEINPESFEITYQNVFCYCKMI